MIESELLRKTLAKTMIMLQTEEVDTICQGLAKNVCDFSGYLYLESLFYPLFPMTGLPKKDLYDGGDRMKVRWWRKFKKDNPKAIDIRVEFIKMVLGYHNNYKQLKEEYDETNSDPRSPKTKP